jgi:hypothetical protein
MSAPSPLPDENDRAFSTGELAVVRRAYARQLLAILGVDNPAIEAAYAAVPREAFLEPPPWTASSPFGGIRPLPGGGSGDSLSGPRHRPRPGARRQQRQPVAPRQNFSRRSAQRPASASSMSAPARVFKRDPGRIGRAIRLGHGGRVRRRAGRASQELPFRTHQRARRLRRWRPLAENPGRRDLRQFRSGAAG